MSEIRATVQQLADTFRTEEFATLIQIAREENADWAIPQFRMAESLSRLQDTGTTRLPRVMYGRTADQAFVAEVSPDGSEWRVDIFEMGHRFFRTVPTNPGRPDNGALDVSRMLRREFGITGTYPTH